MNRFFSAGDVKFQMKRLLVCMFSCKMSTPDQYEEKREEKEEKYNNQNSKPYDWKKDSIQYQKVFNTKTETATKPFSS